MLQSAPPSSPGFAPTSPASFTNAATPAALESGQHRVATLKTSSVIYPTSAPSAAAVVISPSPAARGIPHTHGKPAPARGQFRFLVGLALRARRQPVGTALRTVRQQVGLALRARRQQLGTALGIFFRNSAGCSVVFARPHLRLMREGLRMPLGFRPGALTACASPPMVRPSVNSRLAIRDCDSFDLVAVIAVVATLGHARRMWIVRQRKRTRQEVRFVLNSWLHNAPGHMRRVNESKLSDLRSAGGSVSNEDGSLASSAPAHEPRWLAVVEASSSGDAEKTIGAAHRALPFPCSSIFSTWSRSHSTLSSRKPRLAATVPILIRGRFFKHALGRASPAQPPLPFGPLTKLTWHLRIRPLARDHETLACNPRGWRSPSANFAAA